MSDEEVQTKAPAKRGRKPNPEKAAAKKEAAKNVKNGDDGDAPPVKRGRGRPKGTGTKKVAAKTNGTTASKGRRGRSKKEEKKDSSAEEEEEDNAKSSANEEEDEEDDDDE